MPIWSRESVLVLFERIPKIVDQRQSLVYGKSGNIGFGQGCHDGIVLPVLLDASSFGLVAEKRRTSFSVHYGKDFDPTLT